MSPRHGLRPLAALLLVAVLAVGCTGAGDELPSPEPSPTPDRVVVDEGDRIAVVIGPPSRVPTGEAAALESAAAALDLDSPGLEDVAEVRVLRATADEFVADLVELVVTDGYDVVCVVGTGTAALLDAVARVHRATRFCGTDTTIDTPPANVAVVGLDTLGLAELAAAAVTGSPSPVALVAGSTVGPLASVREAFEKALGPGPVIAPPEPQETAPSEEASPTAITASEGAPEADATATPQPSPSPTPVPVPSPPPARVVAVTSEGAQVTSSVVDLLARSKPSVAVMLAPGAGEAGRVLAEAGTSLVVVAAWATDEEGQLPPGVLVAVDVDWARSLRTAIVSARAQDGAGVQLLGLADGAFGVTAGAASGADAALRRAEALLSERLDP